MKRRLSLLLAVMLVLAGAGPALAQFYGPDQTVHGYTRQDGTYVQPYHRTVPDHDPFNNYSTRGNINPWTGERGTVNPYRQPHANDLFGNPYGSQGQPRRSRP